MNKCLALFLAVLLLTCGLSSSAETNTVPMLTIEYFPAELHGQYTEFIPNEAEQSELIEMIRGLNAEKMTNYDEPWPDEKEPPLELIIRIHINAGEYSIKLTSTGWVRIIEQGGSWGVWLAQDASVMEYVLNLMKTETGYEPFDTKQLRGIVCAELIDGERYTGKAHEPVVVTDADKLIILEEFLSNAQPSYASGCPFGYGKIIVTTEDGSEYALYPATDSCPMFFAEGSFFDYEKNPGDEEYDANQELFDLFGGMIASDYYYRSY